MNFRMWRVLISGILLMGLSWQLAAQVTPGKRTVDPTRPNTGRNGLPNTIPGVQTDSLESDSTEIIEEIVIKPETRFVSRLNLMAHREYLQAYKFDFATTHLHDELSFAQGFVQSLGQISKPYQVFHQGFSERYFSRPFWRDPVMGRYNRYILNGETQAEFLDTRTPYVNMQFMQGGRRLQISSVMASINVSPFVNVTAYTKSRQSEGAYPQFVSDDRILYATTNIHTPNRRYYAFVSGTYNEAGGVLNGGTYRAQDSLYRLEDGIIIDNSFLYNGAFFKNQARMLLDDADFKTTVKTFNLDHYYHLIGAPSDSTTGQHRLTLRHSLTYEYMYQRFFDETIDSAFLAQHLVAVYPTLVPGENAIGESMRTDRTNTFGAASYTYEGPFRFHAQAELGYEGLRFLQDSTAITLNTFRQKVKGQLQFSLMDARLEVERKITNLFAPETWASLEVDLFPFPARDVYDRKDTISREEIDPDKQGPPVHLSKDTVQVRPWDRFRPLRIYGRAEINDLNPTLFQTYFRPDSANAFLPNGSLGNQQFSSYRIGAAWRQAVPIIRGDTLLPNHAYVHGFYSRAGNMITYDAGMVVRQAPDGESLTWYGVETGFRYRLLRKIYLETDLTFQESGGTEDKFLSLYTNQVPRISGKTSFYYDNRSLGIAAILRLGVEFHYNTAFVGQTVDPLSREFFPTNYEVPAYARMDVFFATQIKRTYIYAKLSHVNEGIFLAGYYTTPFYPMLERTFTLGINWSFYD